MMQSSVWYDTVSDKNISKRVIKMNLQNIMNDIQSGLTGDPRRDAQYLYDQVEQYKNSEYAEDVARGCAEILRQMMPEKERKMMDMLLRQDTEINEAMNKAQAQMNQGHMTDARKTLADEIKKVEHDKLYQDTTDQEFRSFDDPFEQVIYMYRSNTKRQIERADEAVGRLYFLNGYLLSENAEMGAARASFNKALRYNPVSSTIGLQIADTYKQEGKLNKFADATMEVLHNAFSSKAIAQCMRNFGYFFSEREDWQPALAFNLLSLTFDEKNQEAENEIDYIHGQAKAAGVDLHPPIPDDFKEYEGRYGFMTHADPDVIGIAWSTGKHNYEEGDLRTAKYFLNIVYELTKDEETKGMLDQIEKAESEGNGTKA